MTADITRHISSSRPCPVGRRKHFAVAALLALAAACPTATLAGNGEDDAKAPKASASQLPNIYVDMRTNYFTVPAGTLNIGFGNSLSLPSLSSLSSVSGQGASIDLPLTVDFNERFSVFGGITASTSKTDLAPWSSLAVASWNVGIQADIIEQGRVASQGEI